MEADKIDELKKICQEMRKDCLIMAEAAGSQGFHFGAALSMIEITAVLYLEVMKIGKDLFYDEFRDRFILSKGHGVPAVYSVLKQMGVLSLEDLRTFKADDTILYGHPSLNKKIGIEVSSGSLGQGLSYAVGAALALRRKENTVSRVFVLLGDGECNEGSVWEAALCAAKYGLKNLTAIIDYNHLQYDGAVDQVMPMESMKEKWNSFGWETCVINGHDIEQCYEALCRQTSGPRVILADTIKGKGISFMENVPSWHHGVMTKEQAQQAWKEVAENED